MNNPKPPQLRQDAYGPPNVPGAIRALEWGDHNEFLSLISMSDLSRSDLLVAFFTHPHLRKYAQTGWLADVAAAVDSEIARDAIENLLTTNCQIGHAK